MDESTAPQVSSSNMKSAKKIRKYQIEEILEKQNFILEAVRNLNERLEAIAKKVDDEKMNDLKDIRASQGIMVYVEPDQGKTEMIFQSSLIFQKPSAPLL